jgi:hypothetical protein
LPDEGCYRQADRESWRNFVAVLFRPEGRRGVEDVRQAVEALIDRLKEPELVRRARPACTG